LAQARSSISTLGVSWGGLAWHTMALAPPLERSRSEGRLPLEFEILELTNEFRAEIGLEALAWHKDLAGIAKRHATMVAEGRAHFSHDGAAERFASCSTKCTNVAENLARSDGFCRDDLPEAAVNGWRDSEGHRRNLVGPFDVCGIGWAASDSGTIFVTQLLALLDETSHRRGQLREQVTDVACSTPSICFLTGLAFGGPWAAVCTGIAGRALDLKYGFKVASVPRVLTARARGLIRRRACSRCGTQASQTSDELLVDASGTLLCSSCHPALEASDDAWCYVE